MLNIAQETDTSSLTSRFRGIRGAKGANSRKFSIRSSVYCLLIAIFAGCLSVVSHAAPPKITAAKPVPRAIMKLERDYVTNLDGREHPLNVGSVVTLQMSSGKIYPDLEVAQVERGSKPNTFKQITFKPVKGVPPKIAPAAMRQIRTPDNIYDVVIDPASKSYLLIDQKLRDEVAARRLESKRNRLWEEPKPEEVAEAKTFYEDLMQKAQADNPQSRFHKVETQYFVFYTDMPPAQVAGYIANLDKMYDQLCVLFSIPVGTNIWVGKCPVIVFTNPNSFHSFEAKHMDTSDTQGIAGLSHQWSDGRVITICGRGDDPVFFAVVLVHETAHGFLHRIRSTSRIPSWMNEGVSEWIASVVVPQSSHIANRMTGAMPQIRSTGSLGGLLSADAGIDGWQYGVAATMTQFLVSTDANAYRGLITAIKEGYTWQEALELTYGITPEQLVSAYGRQLGLNNLQP
jgi:hypothetical protein